MLLIEVLKIKSDLGQLSRGAEKSSKQSILKGNKSPFFSVGCGYRIKQLFF